MTDHVPSQEPYLRQGEIAKLMGVSTRTIRNWTAEGMPCESWGMRIKVYRASECVAWARARAKNKEDR